MSVRGRFRAIDRLLHARDFKRVGSAGRRMAGREFVVLAAAGRDPTRARLGITASRRVGNAVARNRVKRAVREWFRAERTQLDVGTDYVVIARKPAASLTAREIGARLSTQCGLKDMR